MQEFVDLLFNIRSNCTSARDRLSARHSLLHTDVPISAFGMIYNVVTSALEQSSHYANSWGNPTSISNETQDGRERLQRLMLTSKTMFIWSMSAVEYNSKQAIENIPNILTPRRAPRDLYFGEIIKTSADHNLIASAKRPLWFGINKIRNRLVHNNGIANEDLQIDFHDGLRMIMNDRVQMAGNMMTFPRLTSWLVQEYAEWCNEFLARRA